MSATASKAPTRPRIVISATEHARLMALADAAEKRAPDIVEYLTDELTRADIVDDEQFDPNVIRMGSTVTYRDEAADRDRTVTLVYPDAANIEQNRISILTPIGSALIGLSAQQTISWRGPDGRESMLTVLSVSNEEAQ